MAESTTNYGLTLWGAEDSLLRADLNSDHGKIEAALGSLAEGMGQIVTGSYSGTGSYGSGNPKSLNFGFPAKLVIILRDDNNINFSGLFLRPCARGIGRFDGGAETLAWNDRGVSWHHRNASSGDLQLNTSGAVYRWFAIG